MYSQISEEQRLASFLAMCVTDQKEEEGEKRVAEMRGAVIHNV